MGPGFVVLLAVCLASTVGQMGGGFHGRGGPPGPPPFPGPPPGPPPGSPPGPPPMQPGNYVCCQTAGNPCCQNGQSQGQAQTTPGPWSGYTLSPAAQGSFRGGSNASYYPANWTIPSTATTPLFPANVTALAPIGIPDSSVLLPNGTVRFPNGTALLTRYAAGAVPPVARLPSGVLMFPNGTVVSPAAITSFPPPGIPLNATAESSAYPPVYLPASSAVFHNGSLASSGRTRIDTVFVRGFVYNCVGITCHHVVPAG